MTSSGQTITYADMEQVIIDGRGGDDTINVNLGSEVGAAAFPLPSFVLLQGGGGTDLAILTYPQSCTIDEEASPVTISLLVTSLASRRRKACGAYSSGQSSSASRSLAWTLHFSYSIAFV